MAVRSSLGASRSRLIGQLLAESLLLALGGGALGCLFAYARHPGRWSALIPDGLIPREAQIRLNLPVLLFSLALAIADRRHVRPGAGAQATARQESVEPLKDAGKGVSGGFRKRPSAERAGGRRSGAFADPALGRGTADPQLRPHADGRPGLQPDGYSVARLPFPRGQYETAAEKQRFFRDLLARVHRLPGVVAAAESTTLPPYGGVRREIDIPGKTHTETWDSFVQLVSEGYFPTLRLQTVRGRTLSEADVDGARKVAVVNQTLVEPVSAGRGSDRQIDSRSSRSKRPAKERLQDAGLRSHRCHRRCEEPGNPGAARLPSCRARTASRASFFARSWCGRPCRRRRLKHVRARDLGGGPQRRA